MAVIDRNHRSRFPFMPFYVDDWLASNAVASFSVEQRGAYIALLIRQWKADDGILSSDERTLAQWSGLGARWAKVGRPIVARCFVKYRGGIINETCRRLWEKTQARSRQAREAANARWEE
jgi:uncharacterized protein YdaU (DUF1376 family)